MTAPWVRTRSQRRQWNGISTNIPGRALVGDVVNVVNVVDVVDVVSGSDGETLEQYYPAVLWVSSPY
jgi:hypothetical protein